MNLSPAGDLGVAVSKSRQEDNLALTCVITQDPMLSRALLLLVHRFGLEILNIF